MEKNASNGETRRKLESAFRRLRAGTPRIVPTGSRITPASVAREAGVDRSTLYRFHEAVLVDIRAATHNLPKQRIERQKQKLDAAVEKLREYRAQLLAAGEEIAAWARQNYALQHKVNELEERLKARDGVIAEFQVRTNRSGA